MRPKTKFLPLLAILLLLLGGVWLFGSGSRVGPAIDVTAGGAAAAENGRGDEVDAVGPDVLQGEAGGEAERTPEAQLEPGEDLATAAASGRGSVVVEARLENGEPVPDFPFFVKPSRRVRLGQGIIESRTGADGTARIEDLAPGKASVWSVQGGREKDVTVVPGEDVVCELVLKNTVSVYGRVVDPGGEPVPFAEVWVLGRWREWHHCMPATRSDAKGEFRLAPLTRSRSLGATLAGYGPSNVQLIFRPKEDVVEQEVILTLTVDGGALRGRVLSAAGMPVQGARVTVGETPAYRQLRDGSELPQWKARHMLTDDEGRYAFAGLFVGVQPVRVLVEGSPIIHAEVEISKGKTAVLDLQFEPACEVAGTVFDDNGEPLEGATVLAMKAPFVDPFPSQGPIDRGSPFPIPAVRSAANGTYTLTDLPAGAVHLYAEKGTSMWGDGNFEGATAISLEVAPEAPGQWDPVISLGQRIHGRVLYADGSPMVFVFVSALVPGVDSDERFVTYTEKDGQFSISGLENKPYTVSVQLRDQESRGELLEENDVLPSEKEVVLTANFSKAAVEEGTAQVRIVDSAKRLKGRGRVQFAYAKGTYYASEEDGVWRSSLAPRRYYPRIVEGDEILGYGEWFEVVPGQDIDVGEVHTAANCSLTVAVVRPPGVSAERVSVKASGDDKRYQRWPRIAADETEITFDDTFVGSVTVKISGTGIEEQSREVQMVLGVPVRETFILKAAQ